MKRMNRARRNVALSIVTLGTVFATGTSAFAADPVASVDVSNGSSEPQATNVDNAGVIDAAVGFANAAAGVLTGKDVPEFSPNECTPPPFLAYGKPSLPRATALD